MSGWNTALGESLLAWIGTTIGAALLYRVLGPGSGWVAGGIALLFLLVPQWLLDRRGVDPARYALTADPVRRGLALVAAFVAAVFPPFVAGFVAYYGVLCAHGLMPTLCAHWRGFAGASLRLPDGFLSLALTQIVVIALPEEYFYRGYLQGRLADAWPNRWRVFGADVGPALFASAALFAAAHVIVDGNPLRAAVFFPALLFGWMREATGSVLAGTLFHALCNLLIDTLNRSLFG